MFPSHDHGILFNLIPPIANKLDLQKIWTKGNVKTEAIKGGDTKTYYYLTKYLYKQRNYNIWTFKPFQLMSTKPFLGESYLKRATKYHKQKEDLITTFNGQQMLLPRIYREHLPNYLKEPTKQKILEYTKENEKKSVISAKKQKHHWEILKYFQQETREHQDKLQNILFNQKFTQNVNL